MFTDGDWIESKDQSLEGIRLVQAGNVGSGYFKNRAEKARYISDETFARLRCTEVLPGDCLVSRLPDPVGRVCLIPDTGTRMITAVDCTIVRFTGALLPEFFCYYSQSQAYADEVDKLTTGSTRLRISRTNLGLVGVPAPSLAEQRRIVAVLDEAFAAIATTTANSKQSLANAGELARGFLLAQMAGDQIASRLLKDVCIVDWGNTELTKAAYNPNGVALAVSATGPDGRIGHAEHEANVPVLSAIGARCGRMFLPTEPFTAIKNTMTFTPRPGLADGKFLFYLLQSIELPQRGAAQPFIAKGDVVDLAVPVPSLEVQHELVVRLEGLLAYTDELTSVLLGRLGQLEMLKHSLLSQAFTGERDKGTLLAA